MSAPPCRSETEASDVRPESHQRDIGAIHQSVMIQGHSSNFLERVLVSPLSLADKCRKSEMSEKQIGLAQAT